MVDLQRQPPLCRGDGVDLSGGDAPRLLPGGPAEPGGRFRSRAAASHSLLTGQLVFSTAFVSACELPNWLHAPRQVNACLERWMTVSALFFPSGMQLAAASAQPALTPGRRGVFR